MATGITFYLFWNTGIHSDDYCAIREAKGLGFWGFFHPHTSTLASGILGPFNNFLFRWEYIFLNDGSLWGYDVIKWITHVLSIWLVYRFAADYLPLDRAVLAAILFVFNPVHETTEYWYMTGSYILTPSLIMYAHHLIRTEKILSGLSIGMLGSFMCYASPPYTFGLSVIFLVEKSYKKAMAFLLPGVLYVIYYFSMTAFLPRQSSGSSVMHRIDYRLSLGVLVKNYVLQVFSFLDAAVGPSFLLKIWYAANSVELFSFLLAMVVILLMVVYLRSERGHIPASVFCGLMAVLLLSFGMFSVTGLYSQMAFNLGNRVTVYGSLIIAFLVASLPLSKKLLVIIALFFILPAFGLSTHWKAWNAQQKTVIHAIQTNPGLARLDKDDTLLVTGNMYSKLGPFSHIEFFCSPWVVKVIFNDTVRAKKIMALPSYISIDGKTIVDRKYGERVAIIGDVYLYQSEKDILTRVSSEELPGILAGRSHEVRHWIQLIGDSPIRSVMVKFGPRLEYLFK